SFMFASEELRADREVALLAVTGLGETLRLVALHLMEDPQIVTAAVRQNGMALRHAHHSLWDDSEIVLEAVKQNGRALRHASKRLCNNREVVETAMAGTPAALAYVGPDLKEEFADKLSASWTAEGAHHDRRRIAKSLAMKHAGPM
ncbi:unnamed protein product, partial [Polarella glacialis]